MPNPSRDKFGKFFVQNFRDKMLDHLEKYLRPDFTPSRQHKSKGAAAAFTPEQKQVVRDLVEDLTTAGMHDLLFAIQEEESDPDGIKVFVDGKDAAKLSDGLHGEIFGDEGWIVRFSKYPSPTEIEGSQWARKFIAENFGQKNDPPG